MSKLPMQLPVPGRPPPRSGTTKPTTRAPTRPLFIPPEWEAGFGRPPLLKGEDPEAYRMLVTATIEAQQPRDFLEYSLARASADETWETIRYRRLKVATVNSIHALCFA